MAGQDRMSSNQPHRRFNPLTGRWVLVSPQRAQRPWLGQSEADPESLVQSHDPGCYLCPGNPRAVGVTNPQYESVFVFTNDFPALMPDASAGDKLPGDPLFRSEDVEGTCKVICFSPDHGRTLPQLSEREVLAVVNGWIHESAELGRRFRSVQVFENKGAAMGCSNPHPHGQIWASSHLPDEPAAEDIAQQTWHTRTGEPMLLALARAEAASGTRVVFESEHWLVIVPFWATWPFETLLLPKSHVLRLPDLTENQSADLARAIRRLTSRYDNLFSCSFPYSMGWHGAPFLTRDCEHWQLHAHFYPPLLRSATVRKFMVGYELLAEAQRDLTPEQAAERLRAQSDVHYLEER